MEDLAALVAPGTPITPEVVATVWHEWFGETTGEPELPTSGMEALAADLQAIQRHRAVPANRKRSAQIIRMVTGSR
ncbi:MAG TPA: hypothetical protein VF867_18985 [Arthrobacter sp.]